MRKFWSAAPPFGKVAYAVKGLSQEVKIKGEANTIFLESYYTGQLYLLKLLTILNLRTTLYIFNSLLRFYNFRKAL